MDWHLSLAVTLDASLARTQKLISRDSRWDGSRFAPRISTTAPWAKPWHVESLVSSFVPQGSRYYVELEARPLAYFVCSWSLSKTARLRICLQGDMHHHMWALHTHCRRRARVGQGHMDIACCGDYIIRPSGNWLNASHTCMAPLQHWTSSLSRSTSEAHRLLLGALKRTRGPDVTILVSFAHLFLAPDRESSDGPRGVPLELLGTLGPLSPCSNRLYRALLNGPSLTAAIFGGLKSLASLDSSSQLLQPWQRNAIETPRQLRLRGDFINKISPRVQ
ncbi:hypothetical protein F5X96DRAFT_524522 [Biscogniauxia mediterranea]|nr:hypothetical protein F5X96DRAFT_524522 [Biscogniauxia mediterranea]